MSSPIPGEWRCDTCGYFLQKRLLSPTTGAVGVDGRLERHECPNDGQLMRQATEYDRIVQLDRAFAGIEVEHKQLRDAGLALVRRFCVAITSGDELEQLLRDTEGVTEEAARLIRMSYEVEQSRARMQYEQQRRDGGVLIERDTDDDA